MNTPFRLDEHRHRPQPPVSAPPDRYFEQLPARVMQRVQAAEAAGPLAGSWLTALSAPVRTALASGVVLGGFAACFWLSAPPAAPAGAADALALVPRQELVQYLLAGEQRVSLTDLAELPAATQALPADAYLHASPAEVQDALDAQPTEDAYL